MKTNNICAAALAGALAFTSARAADAPLTLGETNQPQSASDLAKLKQDPVSGLRQVILQAQVSPDMPGSGKTAGNYSVQPVWPFSINEDWKVITYTILPVVQLPGAPGEDSTVGLGDKLVNLLFAPKKPGAVVWGAGPTIMLPTRTDPALGSDRLGLGPAGVVFYAQDAWSAGMVLQNVWSLGGDGANEVNTLAAQYIFNYNLDDGWFLMSNATITRNWLADSDNGWIVPVGGGAGKIFNIGKQPVSLSVQAFDNVVTPDGGPDWSVMTQFTFLFP
jgi:hypothetical protein